jgi:hypothetical protein
MTIECRPKANEAVFELDPKLYGEDSLEIAAAVFEKRAEVFVAPAAKGQVEVTLQPKKASNVQALERLAREFLNELLNQEYRKQIGGVHKNLAVLLVTQALYSARGGETAKPAPQLTPEQKAEADCLLAEAEQEIRRTMPKRLPPQGFPIPPVED